MNMNTFEYRLSAGLILILTCEVVVSVPSVVTSDLVLILDSDVVSVLSSVTSDLGSNPSM